jgi:hypothetical protein
MSDRIDPHAELGAVLVTGSIDCHSDIGAVLVSG